MHVVFYRMKLMVSKETHIMKVIFSDDLDIKKIKKYLKIEKSMKLLKIL